MAQNEAWQAKWKREQKVGAGGQGTAILVSALADPITKGVLKQLNRQNHQQARGRMRREVVSLQTLATEGLKVPKVLEDNTAEFENPAVQLYFVMEYIAGKTLDAEVSARGPLGLDKSIALVHDLVATIARAHKKGVYHRDIKPNNIMVRDFDANDLVIVDYGLSFNHANEDAGLTETNEQIRNRFLTLPEATTPGGDRRDPRSDITAVCAILYCCLTGKPPVLLRDSSDNPIHRSRGQSVREGIGDDRRLPQLEVLLDRGFAHGIGDRFQSWDELTHRLNALASGAISIEAWTIAAKATEQLRRNDRKTRKVEHGSQAGKWLKLLVDTTTMLLTGRASLFEQRPGHFTHETARSKPADVVSGPLHATVFVRAHDLSCNIHYAIVDRDSQFQLVRRFEITAPRAHTPGPRPGAPLTPNTPHHDGEWQAIYWFDPANWPDDFAVERLAHASMSDAIRLLMSTILPGSEASL